MTAEYFQVRKLSKDGYRGECRECGVKFQKQYHLNNKKIIAERCKQYQKDNAEIIAEYQKKYHEQNFKIITEQRKHYYNVNSAVISEYQKQWRIENKEILSERKSKYGKENREQGRLRGQRYNAKKMQLEATLTLSQWKSIEMFFNNRCAYCGEEKPLAQEHFIPVNKGGEYTHNNILPSCKSCNCSKQDRDFFTWFKKQTFYSKAREQKILKYLSYKNGIQQLALSL